MGKLIFWFVVILAVLFIARLAGARAAGKRAPRAEAVLLGGQTWCSSDHARRGADRG